MIIDFSIKNFRSFKDEESFSLVSDSGKSKTDNTFEVELINGNKLQLLKTAVIYGANGSGKTNVIRSIYALKWFVTHSMDFKVDKPIPCYEPYELDVDTINEPTETKVSFILAKTKYIYTIKYNQNSIIYESLIFYPTIKPATLFERKLDSESSKPDFIEVSLGQKLVDKKIPKKVFKNQLYLSKFGSDTPHEQLTEVYKYFANLEIWNALEERNIHELRNEISNKISKKENVKFREKLSDLLKVADIKIESIFAKELKKEDLFNLSDEKIPDSIKEKIFEQYRLKTFAIHKLYKGNKEEGFKEFDLEEKESRGTNVLFALGGILLKALETGGTVFFDELDNSLHPKLSRFLIRLFNNPISNPLNAQLIFATHDVTFLDKDIFRKDQIWFTEKNKFGSSELYSAKHVEGLREDTNFELWYRTGKFGGSPKIKELKFIFGDE
jgi:AAA15 family ATPase/GTPase